MPSTIEQTKEAILTHGGKASKHQIARELKISLDYAGLILGELKRKGEIAFSDGFYVLTASTSSRSTLSVVQGLTSIKKDVIQDKEKKKPTIPSKRVDRGSNRLKRAKNIKKSRIVKRVLNPLSSILGISESLARILEKAGYHTIESLAEAPISMLMAATKLELHTAAQLINQARKVK